MWADYKILIPLKFSIVEGGAAKVAPAGYNWVAMGIKPIAKVLLLRFLFYQFQLITKGLTLMMFYLVINITAYCF